MQCASTFEVTIWAAKFLFEIAVIYFCISRNFKPLAFIVGFSIAKSVLLLALYKSPHFANTYYFGRIIENFLRLGVALTYTAWLVPKLHFLRNFVWACLAIATVILAAPACPVVEFYDTAQTVSLVAAWLSMFGLAAGLTKSAFPRIEHVRAGWTLIGFSAIQLCAPFIPMRSPGMIPWLAGVILIGISVTTFRPKVPVAEFR